METKRFKVVVAGHRFQTMEPERQILAPIADLIESQPQNKEELIECVKHVDAVLNQKNYLTRDIIEQMENCKVIVHYGIGTDKVDSNAAADCGIYVCRIPDYCVEEVATHAMALLLAFERRIYLNMANMANGMWTQSKPGDSHRLKGRVLGFLGFGNIARRVSQFAAPFGFRMVASDPFVKESVAKDYNVELMDFYDMLECVDYLSIHSVLNDKTRGMINAKAIAHMKKDAVLINVSRGRIIDEPALIHALNNRSIRGAALDVFDTEPIQTDNPLLSMDNVVLSPHSAWYSDEAQEVLKKQAATEILNVLSGKSPMNPVNNPAKRIINNKIKEN